MRYYKIIKNDVVVGTGSAFLRWYASSRAFFYCELEKANVVQDVLTEKFYHIDWLKRPPEEASGYEEAELEFIDETEYDEIIELLGDGEEVPVEPEVEPEPVNQNPDPEPEPEEKPMTVAEMRARIAELTEYLQGESRSFTAQQTYYKNDLILNGSHIYYTKWTIIKGETVNPGVNCSEISLDDLFAMMQAQNKGE